MWVADGSPTHTSTPVKIDAALQFVPKNTDPREFKKLQQQIKDNRRADKITSGPQSHILEGVSWEEAKKLQDANISATGDQVILVGAASKGIIQRGFQHNALVYKTPYAKNPFDTITDEEIEEYKKTVERKQRGESFDEDQTESEPLSSSLQNSRPTNDDSGGVIKSPLLSPTSAASETEEESRDEPRVLRIETKQVPRPSQAEVVLSDAESDFPDPSVERSMSLRYPEKVADATDVLDEFKRSWSLGPEKVKSKDSCQQIVDEFSEEKTSEKPLQVPKVVRYLISRYNDSLAQKDSLVSASNKQKVTVVQDNKVVTNKISDVLLKLQAKIFSINSPSSPIFKQGNVDLHSNSVRSLHDINIEKKVNVSQLESNNFAVAESSSNSNVVEDRSFELEVLNSLESYGVVMQDGVSMDELSNVSSAEEAVPSDCSGSRFSAEEAELHKCFDILSADDHVRCEIEKSLHYKAEQKEEEDYMEFSKRINIPEKSEDNTVNVASEMNGKVENSIDNLGAVENKRRICEEVISEQCLVNKPYDRKLCSEFQHDKSIIEDADKSIIEDAELGTLRFYTEMKNPPRYIASDIFPGTNVLGGDLRMCYNTSDYFPDNTVINSEKDKIIKHFALDTCESECSDKSASRKWYFSNYEKHSEDQSLTAKELGTEFSRNSKSINSKLCDFEKHFCSQSCQCIPQERQLLANNLAEMYEEAYDVVVTGRSHGQVYVEDTVTEDNCVETRVVKDVIQEDNDIEAKVVEDVISEDNFAKSEIAKDVISEYNYVETTIVEFVMAEDNCTENKAVEDATTEEKCLETKVLEDAIPEQNWFAEDLMTEENCIETKVVEDVMDEDNYVETKGVEDVITEGNCVESKVVEDVITEDNCVETKVVEDVITEHWIVETKGTEEIQEENSLENEVVAGIILEGNAVETKVVEDVITKYCNLETMVVEDVMVEDNYVETKAVEDVIAKNNCIDTNIVEDVVAEDGSVETMVVEDVMTEDCSVKIKIVEDVVAEGNSEETKVVEVTTKNCNAETQPIEDVIPEESYLQAKPVEDVVLKESYLETKVTEDVIPKESHLENKTVEDVIPEENCLETKGEEDGIAENNCIDTNIVEDVVAEENRVETTVVQGQMTKYCNVETKIVEDVMAGDSSVETKVVENVIAEDNYVETKIVEDVMAEDNYVETKVFEDVMTKNCNIGTKVDDVMIEDCNVETKIVEGVVAEDNSIERMNSDNSVETKVIEDLMAEDCNVETKVVENVMAEDNYVKPKVVEDVRAEDSYVETKIVEDVLTKNCNVELIVEDRMALDNCVETKVVEDAMAEECTVETKMVEDVMTKNCNAGTKVDDVMIEDCNVETKIVEGVVAEDNSIETKMVETMTEDNYVETKVVEDVMAEDCSVETKVVESVMAEDNYVETKIVEDVMTKNCNVELVVEDIMAEDNCVETKVVEDAMAEEWSVETKMTEDVMAADNCVETKVVENVMTKNCDVETKSVEGIMAEDNSVETNTVEEVMAEDHVETKIFENVMTKNCSAETKAIEDAVPEESYFETKAVEDVVLKESYLKTKVIEDVIPKESYLETEAVEDVIPEENYLETKGEEDGIAENNCIDTNIVDVVAEENYVEITVVQGIMFKDCNVETKIVEDVMAEDCNVETNVVENVISEDNYVETMVVEDLMTKNCNVGTKVDDVMIEDCSVETTIVEGVVAEDNSVETMTEDNYVETKVVEDVMAEDYNVETKVVENVMTEDNYVKPKVVEEVMAEDYVETKIFENVMTKNCNAETKAIEDTTPEESNLGTKPVKDIILKESYLETKVIEDVIPKESYSETKAVEDVIPEENYLETKGEEDGSAENNCVDTNIVEDVVAEENRVEITVVRGVVTKDCNVETKIVEDVMAEINSVKPKVVEDVRAEDDCVETKAVEDVRAEDRYTETKIVEDVMTKNCNVELVVEDVMAEGNCVVTKVLEDAVAEECSVETKVVEDVMAVVNCIETKVVENVMTKNCNEETKFVEGVTAEDNSVKTNIVEEVMAEDYVETKIFENVLTKNYNGETKVVEDAMTENNYLKTKAIENIIPEKSYLETKVVEDGNAEHNCVDTNILEILMTEDNCIESMVVGDVMTEGCSVVTKIVEDVIAINGNVETKVVKHIMAVDNTTETKVVENVMAEDCNIETKVVEDVMVEENCQETMLVEDMTEENCVETKFFEDIMTEDDCVEIRVVEDVIPENYCIETEVVEDVMTKDSYVGTKVIKDAMSGGECIEAKVVEDVTPGDCYIETKVCEDEMAEDSCLETKGIEFATTGESYKEVLFHKNKTLNDCEGSLLNFEDMKVSECVPPVSFRNGILLENFNGASCEVMLSVDKTEGDPVEYCKDIKCPGRPIGIVFESMELATKDRKEINIAETSGSEERDSIKSLAEGDILPEFFRALELLECSTENVGVSKTVNGNAGKMELVGSQTLVESNPFKIPGCILTENSEIKDDLPKDGVRRSPDRGLFSIPETLEKWNSVRNQKQHKFSEVETSVCVVDDDTEGMGSGSPTDSSVEDYSFTSSIFEMETDDQEFSVNSPVDELGAVEMNSSPHIIAESGDESWHLKLNAVDNSTANEISMSVNPLGEYSETSMENYSSSITTLSRASMSPYLKICFSCSGSGSSSSPEETYGDMGDTDWNDPLRKVERSYINHQDVNYDPGEQLNQLETNIFGEYHWDVGDIFNFVVSNLENEEITKVPELEKKMDCERKTEGVNTDMRPPDPAMPSDVQKELNGHASYVDCSCENCSKFQPCCYETSNQNFQFESARLNSEKAHEQSTIDHPKPREFCDPNHSQVFDHYSNQDQNSDTKHSIQESRLSQQEDAQKLQPEEEHKEHVNISDQVFQGNHSTNISSPELKTTFDHFFCLEPQQKQSAGDVLCEFLLVHDEGFHCSEPNSKLCRAQSKQIVMGSSYSRSNQNYVITEFNLMPKVLGTPTVLPISDADIVIMCINVIISHIFKPRNMVCSLSDYSSKEQKLYNKTEDYSKLKFDVVKACEILRNIYHSYRIIDLLISIQIFEKICFTDHSDIHEQEENWEKLLVYHKEFSSCPPQLKEDKQIVSDTDHDNISKQSPLYKPKKNVRSIQDYKGLNTLECSLTCHDSETKHCLKNSSIFSKLTIGLKEREHLSKKFLRTTTSNSLLETKFKKLLFDAILLKEAEVTFGTFDFWRNFIGAVVNLEPGQFIGGAIRMAPYQNLGTHLDNAEWKCSNMELIDGSRVIFNFDLKQDMQGNNNNTLITRNLVVVKNGLESLRVYSSVITGFESTHCDSVKFNEDLQTCIDDTNSEHDLDGCSSGIGSEQDNDLDSGTASEHDHEISSAETESEQNFGGDNEALEDDNPELCVGNWEQNLCVFSDAGLEQDLGVGISDSGSEEDCIFEVEERANKKFGGICNSRFEQNLGMKEIGLHSKQNFKENGSISCKQDCGVGGWRSQQDYVAKSESDFVVVDTELEDDEWTDITDSISEQEYDDNFASTEGNCGSDRLEESSSTDICNINSELNQEAEQNAKLNDGCLLSEQYFLEESWEDISDLKPEKVDCGGAATHLKPKLGYQVFTRYSKSNQNHNIDANSDSWEDVSNSECEDGDIADSNEVCKIEVTQSRPEQGELKRSLQNLVVDNSWERICDIGKEDSGADSKQHLTGVGHSKCKVEQGMRSYSKPVRNLRLGNEIWEDRGNLEPNQDVGLSVTNAILEQPYPIDAVHSGPDKDPQYSLGIKEYDRSWEDITSLDFEADDDSVDSEQKFQEGAVKSTVIENITECTKDCCGNDVNAESDQDLMNVELLSEEGLEADISDSGSEHCHTEATFECVETKEILKKPSPSLGSQNNLETIYGGSQACDSILNVSEGSNVGKPLLVKKSIIESRYPENFDYFYRLDSIPAAGGKVINVDSKRDSENSTYSVECECCARHHIDDKLSITEKSSKTKTVLRSQFRIARLSISCSKCLHKACVNEIESAVDLYSGESKYRKVCKAGNISAFSNCSTCRQESWNSGLKKEYKGNTIIPEARHFFEGYESITESETDYENVIVGCKVITCRGNQGHKLGRVLHSRNNYRNCNFVCELDSRDESNLECKPETGIGNNAKPFSLNNGMQLEEEQGKYVCSDTGEVSQVKCNSSNSGYKWDNSVLCDTTLKVQHRDLNMTMVDCKEVSICEGKQKMKFLNSYRTSVNTVDTSKQYLDGFYSLHSKQKDQYRTCECNNSQDPKSSIGIFKLEDNERNQEDEILHEPKENLHECCSTENKSELLDNCATFYFDHVEDFHCSDALDTFYIGNDHALALLTTDTMSPLKDSFSHSGLPRILDLDESFVCDSNNLVDSLEYSPHVHPHPSNIKDFPAVCKGENTVNGDDLDAPHSTFSQSSKEGSPTKDLSTEESPKKDKKKKKGLRTPSFLKKKKEKKKMAEA